MKLFLATGNQHKVKEMKKIMQDADVELLSQADYDGLPEVVEDRETFGGNALKKARELGNYVNLPAIADDSGLVVDALDGKPGVYSARFAGPQATDKENNKKLLKLLAEVPDEKRQAYFTCAMAFVTLDGEEEIVVGNCAGKIARQPQGESGFGYDPLFVPEGYRQSFAQLGVEVKNKISHRAKALQKMKRVLKRKDLI